LVVKHGKDDIVTRRTVTLPKLVAASLLALILIAGCGGGDTPTRTPVPTWTPTPVGGGLEVAVAPVAEQPADQPATATLAPPPTATPSPLPPTATPPPEPTDTPADTPTPAPTATPEPPPTATETPTAAPTPTPAYSFDLEAAEKFPTESLAQNVVRIYLYAYSASELAKANYSLRVLRNGVEMTVDEQSSGGLPQQTRETPGPYTRFTNMNVIFVGPEAGVWEIQLVDPEGNIAGPTARFELVPGETARELYVRYLER
jgi:outer membrane biosynthesis protein TonB